MAFIFCFVDLQFEWLILEAGLNIGINESLRLLPVFPVDLDRNQLNESKYR